MFIKAKEKGRSSCAIKQVTIQGDSRMENVKNVDENIATTKKKEPATCPGDLILLKTFQTLCKMNSILRRSLQRIEQLWGLDKI